MQRGAYKRGCPGAAGKVVVGSQGNQAVLSGATKEGGIPAGGGQGITRQ